VLGGAQSLHTNSKDEALGLPTQEAVTLALRTQQIIAEESGVTRTIDPVGGSFYLENLTDELETRALEEFAKVQKMGGALSAIKEGYLQSEIQKSAYDFQKLVDAGRRVVVGVNRYIEEDEQVLSSKKINVLAISKASVRDQLSALKKFKSNRDKRRVENILSRLKDEASKQVTERGNLVPLIIEATRSRATTGEISSTLREAYGEYHPRVSF
jgi:methylmalonyl-CoA mutase N-terminal domain/subunit